MIKTYILNVDFLNDDTLFSKYYDRLPKHRQQRVDRYHFREDKNLSVGAGILMIRELARYGIAFKDTDFVYGVNEKPYIEGCEHLSFNLSHSGNMVVAAFAEGEVGVDIEKIKPTDFKIARKYFTTEEYDYLVSFEDEQKRRDEFYRLWTLKESFMKAVGLGFKLPLNSFSIELRNGIKINQSVNEKKYSFCEYELSGYKLSVCGTEEIDTTLYDVKP